MAMMMDTPVTPPVMSSAQVFAAPTLRDLLEDGIYLLFMLRDDYAPTSLSGFNQQIDRFFDNFQKQAENCGKPANLVEDAKYAFCALLDEIALSGNFPFHDQWARTPLQLRIFGDHLAGKGFFDRLERLRGDPVRNIEALEVFHTCLLLGFQGKYLFAGLERRDSLTERLGQEIQRIRGPKAEFAPNWRLPNRFQEFVRHEMPLWFYAGLLALVGAAVFITYRWLLDGQVNLILGS